MKLKAGYVLAGAEAALCLSGLMLAALAAFSYSHSSGIHDYPLACLPFPFVVWISVRFGARGAATAFVVVSVIATYALVQRRGPFTSGQAGENLLLISSYLGIVAVTSLALAGAAMKGRKAIGLAM